MANMGDFAISDVSTKKVSILLFNDKASCERWKHQALVFTQDNDTKEQAKEALAVHMRDWYARHWVDSTHPFVDIEDVYDALMGWALTTVDWASIASDFVDAIALD